MRPRHRLTVLLSAVLVLLVLLVLVGVRQVRRRHAAVTVPSAADEVPPRRGLANAPRRVDWPRPVDEAPAADAPRRGPIIDSIEVDRTEACAGEQVFATVKAHAAGGGTDRLIVRLGDSNEMGFRLPFRLEKGAAPRERKVFVTGPGGPEAVGDIPPVDIKDCEVEQRVTIDVSLDLRSPHALTLTANVREREGERSFVPVVYEWDFGDGTTQTTSTPEVQHSYEGRSQRTRFSYFLITAKASDAGGRAVQGARAYGFPNFGFGPLVDEKRVVLFSSGGPPEGEQGATPIRLHHGYDRPVRIDHVASKQVFRDADGEREVPDRSYTARELLGVEDLPPGTGTPVGDLSALRPREPGSVRVLEVVGHADGMEARGQIVLSSAARLDRDPLHAIQ
jgi:hypothetical protein